MTFDKTNYIQRVLYYIQNSAIKNPHMHFTTHTNTYTYKHLHIQTYIQTYAYKLTHTNLLAITKPKQQNTQLFTTRNKNKTT